MKQTLIGLLAAGWSGRDDAGFGFSRVFMPEPSETACLA
jgi:hypothetical protein